MARVIMERKICVEPSHLDDKIFDHLLEKIRNDILGHCDQEHGYVTKVYNKIKIINNTISTFGPSVFFQVKFEAEVFKPKIGLEYKGKVCMIFQAGIFVEVFDKMKVLIPVDQMNGYKFDKGNSSFKKGGKTVCQNDIVKIKINLIKYEKQNFSCIGNLC